MSDLATWLRAQLDEDEEARCGNGHPDDFANVLHIARWEPARVLAEVEAKRRILDEHAPDDARFGPEHPTCSACGETSCCFTEWPCPTLRLLALPYAAQPGYLDEWRPEPA